MFWVVLFPTGKGKQKLEVWSGYIILHDCNSLAALYKCIQAKYKSCVFITGRLINIMKIKRGLVHIVLCFCLFVSFFVFVASFLSIYEEKQ